MANVPERTFPITDIATSPALPPDRVEAAYRRSLAYSRVDAMDRLAALAAQLLGCSFAQVSVLAESQIVAGHHGFDLQNRESDLEDSLCTVTVRGQGVLPVADARTDTRVNSLPPVASGTVGSYLGIPLNVRNSAVGALCVFDPQPRSWSDGDIKLLSALADSVNAELEAAAMAEEMVSSMARLDLGFAAAEIGSFDWNLLSDELYWDSRLKSLFGYSDSDFDSHINSFRKPILEEDLPRVEKAIASSIETNGEYGTEFRIRKHDTGELVWITARGRVLADTEGRAVRMIGAAFETTHVHDTSRQISRVLDTITDIFYSVDRDWKITFFNATAEARLNHSRHAAVGTNLWELFPHLRGTSFEEHYRAAMETQEPQVFQDYSTLLDGFFEVRAFPNPDGLSIYLVDVTAERWAEAQRLENIAAREKAAAEATAANERLALLSQVGQVLMDSFDVDSTVERVSSLLVPGQCDHVIVHLIEGGQLRLVSVKSTSFQAETDLRQISPSRKEPDRRTFGAAYVATTGKGQFFDSFTPEIVESWGMDKDRHEAWARVGLTSSVVLPLSARSRTLGAIAMARSNNERMSTEDVRLFEVVAARLALAIDNAQLFEFQRSTSETLQRSLLTPPPEPENLHIETRYVPANSSAQVGGDWYDAFVRQDGSTMLVIGDVMGHDVTAAAAMGQLRTMLRSTAYDRAADSPGLILERVDAMMMGLGIDTLATVIVASVSQSEEEKARGVRQLHWSSAGHLPPLVIHKDGTWQSLAASGLILGFDPSVKRQTYTVELPAYSTLLMYTDGLVERRSESTEDGIISLAHFVAATSDAPLSNVVDRVLSRSARMGTDDDVAVVALRSFPTTSLPS